MNALLVAILSLALLPVGHARRSRCACARASDRDVPHGANELIVTSAGTVSQVEGVVTDLNGKPFPRVVVEVFRVGRADQNVPAETIAADRGRRAACLTGRDGRFCFTGLPGGRYVLRIGTRDNMGMQAVHVPLRLDRRAARRRKGIEVELPPGT